METHPVPYPESSRAGNYQSTSCRIRVAISTTGYTQLIKRSQYWLGMTYAPDSASAHGELSAICTDGAGTFIRGSTALAGFAGAEYKGPVM